MKIISILCMVLMLAMPCFAQDWNIVEGGHGDFTIVEGGHGDFTITDGSDAAVGFVGNVGTRNSGRWVGSGCLFWSTFTASATGQVSKCSVYIGSGGTNNFNVALYSSDGLTKLAESNLKAHNNVDGMMTLTLDVPYTVQSGIQYRCAVGSSNDTNWYVGMISAAGRTSFFDNGVTIADSMPSTCNNDSSLESGADVYIYFYN